MIALFGALFGFLSSTIPSIIGIFKDRADKKQELEIMKLQIESQKTQGVQRLSEINVEGDIRETEALYKSSEQVLTGNKFLDGLISLYNSSVRPTLTYAFFMQYALVKYAGYLMIKPYIVSVSTTAKLSEVLSSLWTQEDMAIFATIVGYWFGTRALNKFMGKK